MIGTAKIPLKGLITGQAVVDDFTVYNTKGEPCGKLKINVTVSDLDGRAELQHA